ncbi:hypothetical protein [Prosthecobacter vanneervenii]|uniref:Lipoprotein n=1 Tax=Prosthecobacter vanneervenii TaxID=48466 RepID=A0A7W7YE86_9BACT|nr:hypothetical protein [Prosthecobacter vanneervenii]MBB5034479.1 hypothetical protein [Prosthecobacter vanneervenii]
MKTKLLLLLTGILALGALSSCEGPYYGNGYPGYRRGPGCASNLGGYRGGGAGGGFGGSFGGFSGR